MNHPEQQRTAVAPSTARIETLESLREHLQWAIEQALRHLCAELGEREVFCGDPARQITAGHFSHTAGRLIRVDDLDTALAALKEIVEQGEGKARGEVWDGVTKPKAVESEVARLISKAQPKQQGGNRQAARGSVEFYQSFKKW